jgi:hypothetical protein
MVVQLQIVQQSRLQVSPAVEAGLLQQFVDAAVETLDDGSWARPVCLVKIHEKLVARVLGPFARNARYLRSGRKRGTDCTENPVDIAGPLTGRFVDPPVFVFEDSGP